MFVLNLYFCENEKSDPNLGGKIDNMRIAVVGTGYVGLVSGTCLAETGVTVTCVDVNNVKIELLNHGGMPIYEPGLAELVTRNREDGRLFFTTSLREALKDADAVFIAVGTPPDEDGSADRTMCWMWLVKSGRS